MNKLKSFIRKIKNFDTMPIGNLIPYFSLYLIGEREAKEITASDIKECFDDLNLKPYSNIPSYLSRNSKSRNSIFIKRKNGYVLSKASIDALSKELDLPVDIPITDELLPFSLLEDCPYYIKDNAKQMIQCYESGLYDATLVMMRKLIETLIIECFEMYGVENEIKDSNGHFLYLSDLIPIFSNCKKWNASRNIKNNMQKVKKYGDLSAHNRKFIAKKSDLNDFKFELRQSIQEIVLTIGYKEPKK